MERKDQPQQQGQDCAAKSDDSSQDELFAKQSSTAPKESPSSLDDNRSSTTLDPSLQINKTTIDQSDSKQTTASDSKATVDSATQGSASSSTLVVVPPRQVVASSQMTTYPTRRMRQPFKILTDIWGVLTSYTFRQEIFAYYDAHCNSFLLNHFEDEDVKSYVNELAKQTAEQRDKWPDMPPVHIASAQVPSNQTVEATNNNGQDSISKEAVVDSILLNLTYRNTHPTDKNILMKDINGICSLVWNDGYRNCTLRPHVFSDVLSNLRKWQSDPLYIKIYTFASGPPQIQKLFLAASVLGNVSEHVTACFDTRHTFKYSAERFRQVVSCLAERIPANLFYLTDSPRKGHEARKAGLSVFIVTREGNKSYKSELLAKFKVINSLDQFAFYEFQ